ncbi:MAG TPA: hypothetical protein EYP59_21670 [Thiotrichaceae bacterium]|nr:hypothetical protein [Thiotrichaceae bacterium]
MNIERYKIQANPFENTEVREILDFADIPVLYVEEDSIGKLYLNYLDQFIEDNIEQRFVIPISLIRLNAIKNGKISVCETFKHPETPFIFLTHQNQLDGCLKNIYLLPNDIFQNLNTISPQYFLSNEEEKPSASEKHKIKAKRFLVEIEELIDSQDIFVDTQELVVAKQMAHLIRKRIKSAVPSLHSVC